jgi:hypothetical protein
MGPSPSRNAYRDRTRFNQDRSGDVLDIQSDFFNVEIHRPLLKTGFAGTWSVYDSKMPCPSNRTGQFTVPCPETETMYIGYGITAENELLNDLWEFNLKDYTWRQIPLSGDVISPRAFASACVGKTHTDIFVFGGVAGAQYFADLHSIDVVTGVVTLIQTTGDTEPCPRSSPIMACHDNMLFLWGGYDGAWPALLHKLDLESLVWSATDPGFSGRNYIPFAVYQDKIYGYGCSKSGGFIVINMTEGTADIQKAEGTSPASEFVAGGMVAVGQYLIYYGGKDDEEFSLVYACDMKRMRWFNFWIIPDEETVSSADGSIDENGIFYITKMFDFSTSYSPETRKIVACLGCPNRDPPVYSIFSIGEALSILHLRDDLLDTLWLSH